MAGAIAARMRINDSSLVFVTSHFASGDHVGDEARRNVDFSEIMRRAEFPYERSIKVDGTMEGLPSCAPPDGMSLSVKLRILFSFNGKVNLLCNCSGKDTFRRFLGC